ncbi:hypothetical protein [Ochrobactrum sp. A-1]|uniref:hypothetical protein n=1 Tax=Ochrobactrum sp. A-1 TaxID=2920940 RepID=UPI001F0B6AFB|nr:hypothetical protein [Ochrobactrum sp. A-1]
MASEHSSFGWTPGNYWFVCRDCRKKQCVGSKHSWRCEDCAKVAAAKWNEPDTRPAPAATDTGLETIIKKAEKELLERVADTYGDSIANDIADYLGRIGDAARSQAEKLLAAERVKNETQAETIDKLHGIITKLKADNAALSARVKELEAQIHVPGSWHCPKCKFTLQQMVMSAQDCSVAPQDKPGEPCPNCQSPLWRVTWKQDAMEMSERCEEQINYRKALETQLAAARKALEPFSKYSGALFERNFNDHDVVHEVSAADGGVIQLTANDFFEARAVLEEKP